MVNTERSAVLQDDEVRKAFGQLEALQTNNGFYFVDGAGYFPNGEPSAELLGIIEQLRDRGVEVVILTSNNPDNLETVALRDQMTSELGLGSDSENTLNPRAIICIFNTKTTDNQREVRCVTGDAYEGIFDGGDMDVAVDKIIDGILDGDIDGGFRNAYQYFEQVFEARDAQATQQAMPTAEVTAVPMDQSPAEEELESVVAQPSQPSFYETHKAEINFGGGTAAILTGLLGVTAITKPKRMFVKNIEGERRKALGEFSRLNAEIGMGFTLMSHIESALKSSYPDQAEEARHEADDLSARWEKLENKQKQLTEAKVGFFRGREGMDRIKELANEIAVEARALVMLIDGKKDQSEDLNAREKAAQTNTDTAKTKLRETKDWFETRREVFRSILPNEDTTFNAVNEMFDEAEQNSYYNTALALRGSDQAIEVIQILDKIVIAVEAFTHGYEVSEALLKDSAAELMDWPELTIAPAQLASSGVILLDEAKAGLSIPDKLEGVVELSRRAEDEFKFAKDFSSAEATVLNLQDENDATIREITDKEFFESHIQGIRDAAATALADANHEASQGNWQEAQTKIGLLRVKTNESLAEMQRLEQLHEKNTEDLKRIAREVGETKDRYGSETRTAWEDLSKNFVSQNFDESDETWDLLRKDMSEGETTDFRGHFILIENILREVTDDPNDQQDIATEASNKNSLKEQKIDEAEGLIREMERRLLNAQQLMDGLLERQKLARKAEQDYQASIDNSASRLDLAEQSIDTPEEDRLVDETVDQQIADARELIDFAKSAAESLIFVAAFEAASKATNLAIQARQSAEEQIQHLKEMYVNLESKKSESSRLFDSVMSEVDDEHDEVVTSSTNQLLSSLKNSITQAKDEEKGLAAFEDHDLARAIEALIVSYRTIDDLRSRLDSSLEDDRDSYQGLLDDLSSAIREADSSISSASSKCNDSDAGYAGDSSLSSARSSLPGNASWGTARSTIESRISSAEQAESYADTARSQAVTAISAAVAERARKAREAADRAREVREAAAERSREAARSFTTTSNDSGRKF